MVYTERNKEWGICRAAGPYFTPPHSPPEDWAEKLYQKGCVPLRFPWIITRLSQIDAYVQAAKERDILIAEVGI